MADKRPILALDFDGVVHSYTSGWKGTDVITDPPVDGFFEALEEYVKHFDVNIYSSRSNYPGGIESMRRWLLKWCPLSKLSMVEQVKFPREKPLAFVGLDDRVMQFEGIWPSAKTLREFKPWNKKV